MEVLTGDSIGDQRRIQSEQLSQEWATFMGRKYCIPTNSGTAALHMCVAALDIGPSDGVILPVHIHGMPTDVDAVLQIADQHNLKVIEDGAQSHGSKYKGRLCGAMGDVAGFSM
ncbi:TPA: hypothetical protein EYN98_02270 [Candidatus Poribacteria bacterium]|nr:hypothetical protein [Candidatus Poribacteria bacterium]HIA64893.1 hypothetical protein [Candidatus Poribacteria bacterium]HIB87509.1 hypothetical protein [Candidatus Poribacteria bacterium]HIC03224.1 hypothetical protein [Candidatus Poribacteria bacterium]HIM11259.1 hypothetical protein [Candidatus Poribacteria bacterium]